MNDKLMVIKKNVSTGKKEWIYTIQESIFQVRNNVDNEYIFKKMNEMERMFSGYDFQYEFKTISEAEYETLMFNDRINDIKSPQTGDFLCFLIQYARYLDSKIKGKESTIYVYNYNYAAIKSWTLQTLLDLKRKQEGTNR